MADDSGVSGNHRREPAGRDLPRRSVQEHLEPQLRQTRGAGHGTPFTAFAPVVDPEADEGRNGGAGEAGDGSTGDGPGDGTASAPAEFVDGARRGRRATSR